MSRKFLPLVRVMSSGKSRLHLVDRDKFVVGRSPDAEILLAATSVSRKHLVIEVRDQNIFIEDLGSSNGSFLNEIRLDAGKKYPVPEKAAIRLGQSNEILTVELMERPVEFDKYQSYLPKFNQDLQMVIEQMTKDSQGKAEAIVKEATKKAEQILAQAQAQAVKFVGNAKEQEGTFLEVAQAKASEVVKTAERQAREALEQARALAATEAEVLRKKATQEIEELRANQLKEADEKAQKVFNDLVQEARERAAKEIDAEFEVARAKARDQVIEIKIQAQLQAEQILQEAHKESARLKEDGLQEFEKLRSEGQKRAQTLLNEAESDSQRLLSQAREASEKMRKSAQGDFDELQLRAKTQSADLVHKGEAEAQQILENARKRAQAIVENQEKESALILSEIGARIKKEGEKEAQRLLAEAQDQINDYRNQAQKEVTVANEKKAGLETQIQTLSQELAGLEKNRAGALSEVGALQAELARLKEDNEKQSSLNAKLEELEKHIKALELQKIQSMEKNSQTMREFELLKKNTMEELERARKEEERRILNMAAIKASEFSQRIEGVIIGEINRRLQQKLTSSQLSEISHKVSEELISLFASETLARETKSTGPERDNSPSFMKSPYFRWGAALTAVLAVVVLIKTSNDVVKKQSEYTNNLIEQQKEDLRFKPELTTEYRSTYTDNILYMTRYLEMKNDSKLQDQWALNLNDFFISELKLSEENMVRFIGLESAMIKRLSTLRESVDARYLEEGINRMREVEKEETEKILQVLQSQGNYQRLRVREKIFITQALRGTPISTPAQNAPPPAAAPAEVAQPAPPVAPAVAPAPAPSEMVTVKPTDRMTVSPRKPANNKSSRSNKKRGFPYR